MDTFLDEIWGKTHYHVKRCCEGYFDSLLQGASATEELLERFRREPSAVRLAREKDKKKGADVCCDDDGGLDIAGIRNDFADGYTIVVDGVERYLRPIGSLAHSLEVELNFPIQVNAYITPPGSQGLVPHYDAHDVLILQISGSKTWHIHDGADVPPHEMQRNKDTAVAVDDLPLPTDLRLEVGDVLYLPRGRVHAAEAHSEPSIHLTVGIHAPTLLMLAVGTLYSHSFQNDRLNAQLPPRHLDADVQATLGEMVRGAIEAVEDPSAIAGGLDLLADTLVRRGRCPPIGPISDTAGIDAQTRVRKYQPLYSRVKEDPDGVVLKFATLSVGAGFDHKAALQFVSTSTEPFLVGDLPGLNAQQQIALARSLIVSGFLVRLA